MYHLLYKESSFPVSKEKLITFIRLRTDIGTNPRTTKNYTYSILSLNTHLGFRDLNPEDKRLVNKALVSASKAKINNPVKRAEVIGADKWKLLLDLKVPCKVRILSILGLTLALRLGEILLITPGMVSGYVYENEFCLKLTLPSRKNSTDTVNFELLCRSRGHNSNSPCPRFSICPAHLMYHLAYNRNPSKSIADMCALSFINRLKARFFEAGCSISSIEHLTGHSIRRSSLQKLFLDNLPDIFIHSVAGWKYNKSSNLTTYLDTALSKIKRHVSRLWWNDLCFNDILILEKTSLDKVQFQ
jgi:hypothetical protein